MSIAPRIPGQVAPNETRGGFIAVYKAVRKHSALVVAAVLLFVGGSLLVSKTTTPIYESSSMLEIMPHAPQPLGGKSESVVDMGTGALYWDTRDYYETQYKILASDRVLSATARDLALANDADFLGYKAPPQKQPTIDDAVRRLHDVVSVDPIKYSRLVTLKVEDKDPRRAKRICDAIAATYIEQNLSTVISATSDAVTWLNGQLDHLKQNLEQNENALYEFKQRNDLPSTSINELSNMLRVEMQELDTALTRTRTKHQELAARSAELAKVSADNPDQLASSELLSSNFLQSLRTEYETAMRDRDSLLAEGKGESHPLVKQAAQRVTDSRAALLREVANIQGAVARDLAIITRQEAGEAGLFEATRRHAVDLNMKEIEYHRLDRERDENEKLYSVLLERVKESDLARMMHVNNIRVVDVASEPRAPIRPRMSVALTVGLFLGLLVGIAAAWTREQLDASLKTPDDLEQKLQVTFLGLLPEFDESRPNARDKRRRRRSVSRDVSKDPPEIVVHTHPLSGVAEAARSLRTNLLFMNPDRPHKTLLVTSAAPSEGKTTVACSIAIALAQGGQRVCIIDCDLRRPRLHRIFNRSGDGGVTTFLVGDGTLDDVAKPTGIDNLWSIPAGPLPPNPADMLQSERFRTFIAKLQEKFDRVVIDSPPLVAVTDSAIISRIVDGTVFVVRAFKTNSHLSAQGLRALRDVDAPIVGAVLNAVNLNKHEYSYYYHYYYYKREGYQSSATREANDEQASPPPN